MTTPRHHETRAVLALGLIGLGFVAFVLILVGRVIASGLAELSAVMGQ